MKEIFEHTRDILAIFWSLVCAYYLAYILIYHGDKIEILTLIIGLIGGTIIGTILSTYFNASTTKKANTGVTTDTTTDTSIDISSTSTITP